MASISRDRNGTRRVLFVAADGTRKAVRLGKVSMRVASEVKARVESLVAADEVIERVDDAALRELVAGG